MFLAGWIYGPMLATRINDYASVLAQRDEAVRLLRDAREKVPVVSPIWRLIGEFLDTAKESKDG